MTTVKTGFETLKSTKRIHGCNREIILSGKQVPMVENYLAYVDRVLLQFRMKLSLDEETSYTMRELREIFSDFFLIKVPEGRTELCRCIVEDGCYLEFNYHCFSENAGNNLYERLKNDFFTET